MPEPEFVDVEGAPLTPDVEWWLNHGAPDAPPDKTLRVVDFSEFIATEEATAEALLGTSQETILPAGGMLLMYGDGGAGKTTLTLDAVSHLASGQEWLGIKVPRPVRTLLIENEGPRGKFRQRLAEKHAAWNGHPPFHPNVTVLEEPWTRFTLRDETHRAGLADTIAARQLDLVVMGPLVTLGMVGGGTPDEISAFEALLRAFLELVDRPVALWILHHENKQGDVSGAWERVPDTLCHVQAQGNGHTRLFWRKARWSDQHHQTTMNLVWGEGRTFQHEVAQPRDPWEDMLAAFRRSDGWRTVKEAAALANLRESDARSVLRELVRRGEMVFAQGPEGRHQNARCYRLTTGAPALWAHTGAHEPLEPSGVGAPDLHHPRRGEGSAQVHRTEHTDVRPDPQEHTDDDLHFA